MRTMPVPQPVAREVLVRVEACGVCGQDIMRRRGAVDHVLGAVLGHEIAGTVAAAGPESARFAVGDRVAATQRRACHACDACREGREVLCEHGRLYGEELDGGYAEYCVVDERSLAHIPSGVDTGAAAIAACAIGTGLHALRLAQVGPGQRVLVTGASGGVGIHALQLARAVGAETVAVTSSADKTERLGEFADSVVTLAEGRFDRQVRARCLQPDVIIEMTSRVTLSESLRAVRRGGTVVIVGNLDPGSVEILPGAFIMREIRLIGSKACTLNELTECLRLLDAGDVRAQLHGSLPLSEARVAHELVESGTVWGRVTLLPRDGRKLQTRVASPAHPA